MQNQITLPAGRFILNKPVDLSRCASWDEIARAAEATEDEPLRRDISLVERADTDVPGENVSA